MRNILFTILSLLIISSCSSSDDLTGEQEKAETTTPLTLDFGIASSVTSRAGITASEFSGSEEIGVFAVKADGTAYSTSSANNCYLRKNLGTWYSDNPILLSEENATLYTYYPWTANATDVTVVPVSVRSSQGTGQSYGKSDDADGQPDYMCGDVKTGVNKNSSTVRISLNHVLSMIAVKFVRYIDETDPDHSFYGDGYVTRLSLVNNTSGDVFYIGGGTMNARISQVTASNTAGTISVYPEWQPVVGATVDYGIPSMLIFPNASTSGKTFDMNVTIDGNDYLIEGLPTPESGFKAGNRYTYTITVKKTYNPEEASPEPKITLEPASITIQSWDETVLEAVDVIIKE